MRRKMELGVLFLLTFFSSAAISVEFDREFNFYFQNVDAGDNSIEAETDTFGLTYTKYMEKVEANGNPHDEAAFLDRISEFSAGGGFVQGDFGPLDLDGFLGLASYTHRKKNSPVVFSVGALINNLDGDEELFSESVSVENDIESFNAGIGFYISNTTMLRAVYENNSTEVSSEGTSTGLESLTSNIEITLDTISLGVKSLNKMGDGTFTTLEFDFLIVDASFEGEFEETDSIGTVIESDSFDADGDGNGLRFGFTFYPSLDTSFSLVYSMADIEVENSDSDSSTLGLSFRSFSNSDIGFGFSYETVDSDDGPSSETDTILFSVISRS